MGLGVLVYLDGGGGSGGRGKVPQWHREVLVVSLSLVSLSLSLWLLFVVGSST